MPTSPFAPAKAGAQSSTLWIPASASLQNEVDLQNLVKGDGPVVDAAAGRLAVAAHRIEANADRADREPMARMRHGRQHLPAVERRVIGLHGIERGEEALVLAFAAGRSEEHTSELQSLRH